MTLDTLAARSIPRYGWHPSLPGLQAPPADTSGLKVLPEVDPRKEMPAVFNQGQLGSCTANATAACFQYDGMLDDKDPGKLARLFIYYGERKLEGTLGQGDTGAMGHDAFKVAESTGVPPETDWPYVISTFEGPPPSAAVKDEDHYKLTKPVKAPKSQLQIKQALSNKQTVAIGFTVYESFEDQSWWSSGEMPVPKRGEQIMGGHEVVICGYLKEYSDYALARNSWGTEFALEGYWLFPWSLLLDKTMCSDFRTIVRSM